MAINFSQVTHIEIPKYPYMEVDYLKFNGTDNYLDLNLLGCGAAQQDAEFEFSLSNIQSGTIIGCVNEEYTFNIYAQNGKLYLRIVYPGTTVYEEMCSLITNAKYKLKTQKVSASIYVTLSRNGSIIFDGGSYYSPNAIDEYTYFYIMAKNSASIDSSGRGTASNFATGKIYSIVIGGNTTPFHVDARLIPYYNTSTDDAGFITLYSGRYIYSYLLNGTVTSSSLGPVSVPKTMQFPTVAVHQITNSNNVVLWRDVRLVSIAISNATTSLPINTSFSFGGTVTATYSDGSTANVTASTIFSGYNMSTSGTQTVTATYTEVGITKTATYSLEVVAVSSIALSGQTTSLPVGGTFSFGGTVTATYTNGTTADVTNSTTFSGYDMSTGGTYTVTASYTENNVTVTATYQLTVASEVTITYRRSITNDAGTLPSSKTVTAGYALTAADLPSGGTTWTIDGWTIDGINKVSVGYVVNEDITLCAVHKRTYTTGSSLFKSAKNHQYEKAFDLTINGGNVGNSTSSGTTKTYALSKTYNATKPSYDYYRVAQLGGWGGLVFSEVTANPCRIEWTPSRSTVTFSSSMSGGTNVYNYGGTYPTLVVRNNSTGSFIYSKTQNNANKITYETVSGAIFYIQHGGNDGGQKYASRADYKQQSDTPTSSQYGITCNAGKATETVYVYTLPPVS